MDRREQIIARMVSLAAAVPGVMTALRNKDDLSATTRPAIIVLDGDENVDEALIGKGGQSVTFIRMVPEVVILLSELPTSVGTEINAVRAAYVRAVLMDAELANLVGPNGRVNYMGCVTSLGRGRKMEGEMGVSFSILYPLRPADL